MAYVEPTSATFLTRFPEFQEVSVDLINSVLAEAIAEVGEHWREADRAPAQLYLTAHLLAVEGGADRSVEAAVRGPETSRKVDDVQVTYGAAGGGVVANQTGKYMTATSYGRRFDEIRRRNFPAGFVAI